MSTIQLVEIYGKPLGICGFWSWVFGSTAITYDLNLRNANRLIVLLVIYRMMTNCGVR